MNFKKPNLDNRRMPDYNWTDGRDELFGLDNLCKKHISPTSVVLEIGSHNGVSTSLFAYYASSVVSVDMVCNDSLLQVKENYGNIIVKTGLSVEQVPLLADNYFDLIYIDADHSYLSVINDIKVSLPKLKKNGVISGHDYCPHHHAQVFKAVNDFINTGIFTNLCVYEDTSWSCLINDQSR